MELRALGSPYNKMAHPPPVVGIQKQHSHLAREKKMLQLPFQTPQLISSKLLMPKSRGRIQRSQGKLLKPGRDRLGPIPGASAGPQHMPRPRPTRRSELPHPQACTRRHPHPHRINCQGPTKAKYCCMVFLSLLYHCYSCLRHFI